MAALWRRERFRQQPLAGLREIDLSGWWAAGLVAALAVDALGPWDLLRMRSGAQSSTIRPNRRAFAGGMPRAFTTVGGSSNQTYLANFLSPALSTTTDLTLMAAIAPAGVTTNLPSVYVSYSAGGFRNLSLSQGDGSAAVWLSEARGASATYTTATSAESCAATTPPRVMAAVWRYGEGLRLYCDGREIAFAAMTEAAQYAPSAIFTQWSAAGTYNSAAPLSLAWRRALSAGEIAALADNLWQVYRPQDFLISFDIGGGGGGDQTIAASDSASGADAISAAISAALGDAASGAEAQAIGAGILLADESSGADAFAIGAALGVADAGAGADGISSIAITATLTDAATGAETTIGLGTIALADAGISAEAASLITATLISAADLAIAQETVSISVALSAADGASAEDVAALLGGTLVIVSDSGVAAEGAALVEISIALSDAGAAAEISAIEAALSLLDLGTGYDMAIRTAPGEARIASIRLGLRDRAVAFAFASREMRFGRLASRACALSMH